MSRKTLFIILAAIVLCFGVCSAEDQWAEIENAGVIRFGVASDYIPFVYTEGTELDGLDIALVKEMGRRLGVSVKPIDMAFSGLIDALLIGQVDLIGGAFSITESRSEVVDYTSAYYRAGGIFLCRAGDEVTEETVRSSRLKAEASPQRPATCTPRSSRSSTPCPCRRSSWSCSSCP